MTEHHGYHPEDGDEPGVSLSPDTQAALDRLRTSAILFHGQQHGPDGIQLKSGTEEILQTLGEIKENRSEQEAIEAAHHNDFWFS